MKLHQDCVIPFLFEHLDIRGAWVSLDQTWAGLTRDRAYPPQVARLLGEMSAVSALIAANLKQPGRMTFQLKGGQDQANAVDLLVLDCDEQLRMRGMARWKEGELPWDTPALLGHGQLLLTLDAAGMRQPYQSLVPLEGSSIATIFEHYLGLSEQQPTRLALGSSEMRAAGLFLQRLPTAEHAEPPGLRDEASAPRGGQGNLGRPGVSLQDPDGWNRVQHLLETLRSEELLGLDGHDLLRRLFPEEDIRVFDPRPVSHHCPEDWEKIHAMLRALGRVECDAILRDHGEIHVRDDICNRDYRFDAQAVAALFEAPSPTLH
ncbi:MAG: Hsp33 family molecular chaperone HslO [Pseudomonadales bacterium]|nr:Hsp33 family molecular chaperone HslO [Pseudomonadales bacterium]